jgi:hypothetical protein
MQEHFIKIIQIEQHLPLRTRFCGEYEQFLGLCVFYADFRGFAAGDVSYLRRQSFVLLLFVYQNVINRKQ